MISEEDVLKIARLAKLELKPEEIKKFSIQLSSVISYVKKLDEVDTFNVAPTSHPIEDIKNRFMTTANTRTLDVKEVLNNAKQTKDNYIVTTGVFK